MAETVAATDIGAEVTFSKKTGGSTYAAFAEITDLKFPEYSRDSVDFTHFGSPDPLSVSSSRGWADPGELRDHL